MSLRTSIQRYEKELVAVLLIALLALIAWVVRYWHILDFGLYSDDLTRIPHAFTISFDQLVNTLGSFYLVDVPHGRPFHSSFIYVIAYVAGLIDGISTLYLIGWVIYTINIVLFFLLIKRITWITFAFLASFLFILFPADTTQIYITQSFGIQTSLTFLLLAFHAFLSNKRLIAFLLATLTLFTYESTFLLFMVAPLLGEAKGLDLVKATLKHSLIVVAILLFVLFIRGVEGDQRLLEVGFPSMILLPLQHMVLGPVVNLLTYVYRPIEVLFTIFPSVLEMLLESSQLIGRLIGFSRLDGSIAQHPGMRPELIIVLVLAFGLCAIVLIVLSRNIPTLLEKENAHEGSDLYRSGSQMLPKLKRLALTSALMLVLSYPLIIVIPAFTIRGRNTRVHFAGVIGGTLLVAIVIYLGYLYIKSTRGRVIYSLLVSLLFSGLIASSFIIQLDYANAWKYQKSFWRELLPLIRDVGEEDVILVTPDGLVDSWQISANTWNLPRVLPFMLMYPESWEEPPRVYRLSEDWQVNLLGSEGRVNLDEDSTVAPPSYYRTSDPANVIFIDSSNGNLVRINTPIRIEGVEFTPKEFVESEAYDRPPHILYELMQIESNEAR